MHNTTPRPQGHAYQRQQPYLYAGNHFMPIVDLSPQSRAEEIQREWPFMWTSIQAICSTIPGAQSVLRARVQHTLANKLVIQGQGSLDLLVGLLCYMTWSFDLSRGKNHYYTLSNLAVLLAVDLGLDRTVPEGSATVLNCVSSAGGAPRQVADEVPRNHDADRALLGCFAAASTLSQATQVPGDPTLVAIARVMKMADDTARVTGRESFSVAPQGVAMLFLQSLKSSVQQIKLTLPPELLQHKVVLSYLYSSEAMISEQILFQHTLAQKSSTFDPGRLEALSVCTQAAKCCVENFLSIGADECAGISCFIMLHFSHSLQLLYRLSLLEEPAWDKATMQATINVLSYLNRAINHLSNAARLHKSNNIFSKSAEALKATFPVWSAALKQTTSVPTATRNTAPVYDGPSSVYPMDLNDDSWFTNVFASWTDQDAPIQTW
ncbi:hypothetical protein PFICI_00301 [Pestalotiopsis fici W106-1]|uniref:Transcription factor domain-containing protein n=1 Tax=Pestalotiopsis fici (strain W106-1 / CGMCC3.15140) TaxID=1229662 RepID=W3XKA0_PESFW|nr:uncharacterized protein PFICI_00301 [Pestalotiopsis fici W106-1]ETS86473.1 hypothetical protein PFICI_00301 [Pestalotiopsis fici W106-1]